QCRAEHVGRSHRSPRGAVAASLATLGWVRRCGPVGVSHNTGGGGSRRLRHNGRDRRARFRPQRGIGMSTSAMKTGVLVALVLTNIAFVIGWIRAVRRHHLIGRPGPADIAIGCITTFLDALGIGSFAPTTALFKFRGKPPDELIPGTLNVGLNAAAFVETLLFVSAVALQPGLLVCMVAAATARAWLGAGGGGRLARRAPLRV